MLNCWFRAKPLGPKGPSRSRRGLLCISLPNVQVKDEHARAMLKTLPVELKAASGVLKVGPSKQ